MPANKPEEIHTLFAEALNGGSIAGILDLYEDDATLISPPGKPVTGKAAIEQAFLGFLAMKPTITMETGPVIYGGLNLALLEAKWVLEGSGPGGMTVRRTGTSREVARRHKSGVWLYAIDDPGVGK